MNFNDFIILIPCGIAMVIGFLIKNTLTFIPNKFIPLICAVIGVLVNVWINLAFTPEILLSGLISGVSATGMFEAVRNLINKKGDV